jgi:hypothetical protein
VLPLAATAGANGLDGQALADALAPELERLAIDAREAEARVRRSEDVAHSVPMIFGTLADGRGRAPRRRAGGAAPVAEAPSTGAGEGAPR